MGVAGDSHTSITCNYSRAIIEIMLSTTRLLTGTSSRIAALASLNGAIRNKHTLPDLPYQYNALEPVISGGIMEVHHSKHHATYVNNLNAAEDKLKECTKASQLNQYF